MTVPGRKNKLDFGDNPEILRRAAEAEYQAVLWRSVGITGARYEKK